jgi:hypothetical protein
MLRKSCVGQFFVTDGGGVLLQLRTSSITMQMDGVSRREMIRELFSNILVVSQPDECSRHFIFDAITCVAATY